MPATTSEEAWYHPWARGVFALGIDYSNNDNISTVSGAIGPEAADSDPHRCTFFTTTTDSSDARAYLFAPYTMTAVFYATKSGGTVAKDFTISAKVTKIKYSTPNGFDLDLAVPSVSTYDFSDVTGSIDFGADKVYTRSWTISDQTNSYLLNPIGGTNTGSDDSQAQYVYAVSFSWSADAGGTVSFATGSSANNAYRVSSDGSAWSTPSGAGSKTYQVTLSGVYGNSWGLYCGVTNYDYRGFANALITDTFGTGSANSSASLPQPVSWDNTDINLRATVFARIPEDWNALEQGIYNHIVMDRPMSFSYYDPRTNDVITRSMHVENIRYVLQKRRMAHLRIRGFDNYNVGQVSYP